MKQIKPPTIHTPRLCLRALEDRDCDRMVDLLTNKEIARTYMLPDFSTREDAVKLFRRLQCLSRKEDRFVYGICLDDRLIGFFNDVEIQESAIELGYAILPPYQNQGYATEVLSAAIATLFAMGYTTVNTAAFEENPASIRVMEKCGMTRLEKTEQIDYRGRTHRCVCFAIRA